MKKFGLKRKLFIIGALPMIVLLLGSAFLSTKNYNNYKNVKKIEASFNVVKVASQLAHFTQIERGKSAAYLNGAIQAEPLQESWKKNDLILKKFQNEIKTSDYKQDLKDEFSKSIKHIYSLREDVKAKSVTFDNALARYTSFINALLNLQTDLAKDVNISSIATSLRSLETLENSKESGGQLRANITAILTKGEAINLDQLQLLNTLFAGYLKGIESKGLNIEEGSKKILSEVVKTSSWLSVKDSFYNIIQNYKEGNYEEDPKIFFGKISKVLEVTNNAISSEKNTLSDQLGAIEQNELQLFWVILGASFFSCFLILVLMTKLSNNIVNNITLIAKKLTDNVNEVTNSSHSIAASSAQLNAAATTSASSLQETVSSIDEISSMIQRNADAANSSTQVSAQSSDAANRGKQTVQAMIDSIEDISRSNDEIAEEMQKNNADISKIVQVISEIGEKTKVINDIVFQTKLLSFNASVEAARAGEHGKGFAVVAEEVGNLASMSGKAALEITEMLDNSIKQVVGIVDKTKKNVEVLVSSSKNKVETGTKTAHECGSALDEILQNVTSVNEMVREIASASSEQSTGVQEVTKAMQELDQTTHQNTIVAEESSIMANTLNKQAEGLDSAVSELFNMVSNKKADENQKTFDKNQRIEEVEETVVEDFENIIQLKQKEIPIEETKSSGLKVAGLETYIPDESDDRFEDL